MHRHEYQNTDVFTYKRISGKIYTFNKMRGNVKHDGEIRLIQIYLILSFGLNICIFIMWINQQWTFIAWGTNNSETDLLALRVPFS